jgi:hypothetical protein
MIECYWPIWHHVRQAKLGASCRENDPVGQGKSTARTELLPFDPMLSIYFPGSMVVPAGWTICFPKKQLKEKPAFRGGKTGLINARWRATGPAVETPDPVHVWASGAIHRVVFQVGTSGHAGEPS